MKNNEILKIRKNKIFLKTNSKIKIGDIVIFEEKYWGFVKKIEKKETEIDLISDCDRIKKISKISILDGGIKLFFGPGMVGKVFDGLQNEIKKDEKKIKIFNLKKKNKFEENFFFESYVKEGEDIFEGKKLGKIIEKDKIKHFFFSPKGVIGKLKNIFQGKLKINNEICSINNKKIFPYFEIPISKKINFNLKKEKKNEIFLTSYKIVDLFFPIFEGSKVIIPGAFGVGKTVFQQNLMNNSICELIIYVACGERGNEVTQLYNELKEIQGLEKKLILICNTSNMPTYLREFGVFLGMNLAEYYAKNGNKILIIFDSLSRWVEGLREIKGKNKEFLGEQGYPIDLAKNISEFFSRTGTFEGGGSITGFFNLSPSEGSLEDLVVKNSLKYTDIFLFLDLELRKKNHFPTINWNFSFSKNLSLFFKKIKEENFEFYKNLSFIHEKIRDYEEIKEIIKIVPIDNLSEKEKNNFYFGEFLINFLFSQSHFEARMKYDMKDYEKILKICTEMYDYLLKNKNEFERQKENILLIMNTIRFEKNMNIRLNLKKKLFNETFKKN